MMLADGQLALLEDRPQDARDFFERLDGRADQVLDLAMSWRARIGQGEALEALGMREDAMLAYESAESGLDDESRLAPVTAGWSDFVAQRQLSGVRLVDLLFRMDRISEALRASRRSLRRRLGSASRRAKLALLDESARQAWSEALSELLDIQKQLEARARNRWKLSEASLEDWHEEQKKLRQQGRHALDRAYALLDSLPESRSHSSPPDGTLRLVVHKGVESLLAFAWNRDGRRAIRIESTPESPKGWQDALLVPFAEEIRGAMRIELMLDAALDSIDVHALELDGRPLISERTVLYDLDQPDLPPRSNERLLLVLDPRSDAQKAVPEPTVWSSLSPLKGQAARRDTVLDRLTQAGVFVFVGHGEVGEDRVTALRVAGREHVTAMDIMALEKVPEVVVLLACEGAQTQGTQGSVDLALHHAFLLAGSRMVIAAPRPLSATLARQFLSTYLEVRAVHDEETALQMALRSNSGEEGDQWALRMYTS